MRNLKLPAMYRGHPLFTTEEDMDEAREIRKLSGRIISAASAVDQMMAEIIADTIFRETKEQRDLILGSVLGADWCSFAAKRKLLNIAVDKFSLLEGPKKSQLERSLKKVMQYRNSFAHGTLAHNGEVQELHYFESTPCTATLDDAYFEQVEQAFLTVWELLNELSRAAKNAA